MGILDGIVEWIAEQVMNLLDMINGAILGALGCDMTTFLRYFPAADTMYGIFVGLGLGLLLLNFVWQLFRNFGVGIGMEAEDPLKLTVRTILFMGLVFFSKDIVNIVLDIGGTPYQWIMDASLPPIQFASFMSVIGVVIGGTVSGSVLLISLVLLIILAWNYVKLLFEAAERYILLGVLVFTAPVAFALGGAQSTGNIFKSWCRMLGGQIFLLIMNAWCLKLFTNMFGEFIANPMGTGDGGNLFIWFLCAIAFLKVSQKIDSFMASLGISVGHTGGSMLGEAMIAARALGGFKKGGADIMGGGKAGGASPVGGAGAFAGGLAGMVSRKAASGMASNLTKEGSGSEGGFFGGLGQKMYESSVGEKGGFASKVIGGVATGNAAKDGVISGERAVEAFNAYMGPTGGIPAAAAVEEAEPGTGMQPTVGQTPMDGHIPMTPEGNIEDGMDAGIQPVEAPTEGEGAADQIPMQQDGEVFAPADGEISEAESFTGAGEQIPTQMEEGFETMEGAEPLPEVPYTPGTGISGQEDSQDISETLPVGAGAGIPPQQPSTEISAGESGSASISGDSGSSGTAGVDTDLTSAAQSGGLIPAAPATPAATSSAGSMGGSHVEGSHYFGTGGSYSGMGGTSALPGLSTFRNVEMGGGRITGVEVSPQHPGGIQFAMYHAGKFSQPEGEFTTVTSRDGEKWYKQYAAPAVERTPVRVEQDKKTKTDRVVYEEKIVQKLPRAPQRRD